jgi:hypothetical protein
VSQHVKQDWWMLARWETSTRYYVARLDRDLFGSWLLTLYWGGRFNRLGRVRKIGLQSAEAAEEFVNALDRLRLGRHYRRTL